MPGWLMTVAAVFFALMTAGIISIATWGVVFLMKDRAKSKITDRETAVTLQRAATSAKKSYVDLHGERPPDLDTGRFDVPPDLMPPRPST